VGKNAGFIPQRADMSCVVQAASQKPKGERLRWETASRSSMRNYFNFFIELFASKDFIWEIAISLSCLRRFD
jgi:hypothetical protein